jgi:hypothetical protein
MNRSLFTVHSSSMDNEQRTLNFATLVQIPYFIT